jgi:hypothetical protein
MIFILLQKRWQVMGLQSMTEGQSETYAGNCRGDLCHCTVGQKGLVRDSRASSFRFSALDMNWTFGNSPGFTLHLSYWQENAILSPAFFGGYWQ